ncbi:hypothetical protein AAE02nite_35910 [Adhaeribacter aerolatus]|uniref:Uncharacterized protein n=1 Tax=Adhaeribacter aerolatus TaxID=670289 RepID=A0A512B2A8_9BACT|nr:hypothetical protein AAE02nite_35910 [Adhaeribacter aerolatus]
MLVTTLTLVAMFYLFMSRAEKDKTPNIITANKNKFPPLMLTGDYRALIQLKDTTILLKESITFLKSDLDTLVAKDLYGGITDSAYLKHMGTLGWRQDRAAAGKITLKKIKEIPYRISLLQKTKNIAVPLLYTPDSVVLNKSTQQWKNIRAVNGAANTAYGMGLDYIPSNNSEIKLLARRGRVLATYPPTTPQSILDAEDNELFTFDPAQIQPLAINDEEIHTTTINFRLLHPFYNNAIGQIVKDWSAGKIIGWLLVSLAALFADKIKEYLLQPLVQKIFTSPKKKVSRARNQAH